jgi:hypothetical protein
VLVEFAELVAQHGADARLDAAGAEGDEGEADEEACWSEGALSGNQTQSAALSANRDAISGHPWPSDAINYVCAQRPSPVRVSSIARARCPPQYTSDRYTTVRYLPSTASASSAPPSGVRYTALVNEW